jgi:hypothetical protein
MLEVLLVFAMNDGMASVSDRVFTSYGECAMFVNELTNRDVVNADYGFVFHTEEGDKFVGQCIERGEYERYIGK